MWTSSRILLLIFALAGIGIMGYLTSLHYAPGEGAFCNLGEGLSCDIVNKSEYSVVMGVPMSVLGLLYFVGVLVAAFWRPRGQAIRALIFFSLVFLGPSLYLSVIEFFVLKNICVFCEASKLLILAIIITGIISIRPVRLSGVFIGGAIIMGILLAAATYGIHSSAGPGKIYTAFAQCLDERGFKMYGSITCVFCARQRVMFGDAFKHIEEIECDPRNSGAQTERCIAKAIKKTPTWIQEDPQGNILHRFDAGVQSLETLSRVSGCELP